MIHPPDIPATLKEGPRNNNCARRMNIQITKKRACCCPAAIGRVPTDDVASTLGVAGRLQHDPEAPFGTYKIGGSFRCEAAA